MSDRDGPALPTILVVDDTPDNLAVMSSLLKDSYNVRIATNGAKALEIALSDAPPDLILLDIMMPGIDGYQVCERLKQNPGTATIPVIFLTAKTEIEDEQKGLGLGAVDYITKPISPPILLARVKSHLALNQMAALLRSQNDSLEREVCKRTAELLAVQGLALKNEQLEAAGKMKSEFLANMSHELRTPLNAIIGFSEVLRDGLMGELTPQQNEYINDIFTSGSHLLLLINDILDLSKMEAGKMTLELEPLQIGALVQASLQVIRELAMKHHLTITVDVPAELPDIWLDERKIKQILYNLLSNAVKFTPENGEIFIKVRQVAGDHLPAQQFTSALELSVRDTGIGISAADQEKLFQPFSQIDSTLARHYEGTGLGLAMIRQLAGLHNGVVSLDSSAQKGAKFTVTLPWRTDGLSPSGVEPALLTTPGPSDSAIAFPDQKVA